MAKTEAPEVTKSPEVMAPPKEQMMHINVRRPDGCKEDAAYVAVNGKSWLVQYNKDMYVPEVVYFHLVKKLRAERARDAKIEMLGR